MSQSQRRGGDLLRSPVGVRHKENRKKYLILTLTRHRNEEPIVF
jgi:hypothetical protein